MKYVFILWLLIFFVGLLVFGLGFIRELIKREKPFRLSARMIAKYFLYLVMCVFPASIIGGMIGSENSFVYLTILVIWSALVVFGLVIVFKKIKTYFGFWFSRCCQILSFG